MASAPSTQSSPSGKQRVLDAAESLFGESSFGDIGVALILERAGVQAPTLYHHFGDKEGLFVAWTDVAFQRIEETIQSRAGGETTVEGLTRYANALLSSLSFDLSQLLRDAPRLQRSESRDRVLEGYMRAIYEPLATLLVQAVAMGEFRNDPIPQLSDLFLAGLISLRNSQVPTDSLENKVSWWCHAFVRAFSVERAVVYR